MEQSASERPSDDLRQLLPHGVLVVEDSPADRHLLEDALSQLAIGHGAACVGSLAEARLRLTERPFSCIILDLSLPDAEGLEAVAVLSAAGPNVPLVVVTGRAADTLVYAALAEGADEYLEKRSLSPHALGDALERALHRRVGRARNRDQASAATLVMNAVDVPTAAIDGSGRITAVNRAWTVAAAAAGAGAGTTGVGVNYLAVCDHAAGAFSDGAAEAGRGIRAVLSGEAPSFSMDYACPSAGVERWFTVRVTPLGELGGGALIAHLNITDMKVVEDRIRREQGRLHTVFNEAAPIFALVNVNGVVEFVTATTTELLGIRARGLFTAAALDRLDPADAAMVQSALSDVTSTPGAQRHVLVRARDDAGCWRHLELSCANMLDDPAVQGIVVAGSDVTNTRRSQITARIESRILRRLPASVVVIDELGTVVYWNDTSERMYGFPAAGALGRPVGDLNIGPSGAGVREQIMAAVRDAGRWEGDYDARRADGSTIPIHMILERVDDDSIGFHGIVGASIDISERRKLEDDLAFQALHDPLTALPNRRLFVENLELAVARAERGTAHAAVLFIDLDDFKLVNDTVGHEIGDRVLQAVAGRIRGVMRAGDIVARLGGDEFVVCCDGVTDAAEATAIATRVQEVLGHALRVGAHHLEVSASVGVALSFPGAAAEALLRNADVAMYAAKDAGKGRMQLFDGGVREVVKERAHAAAGLLAALDGGEITAWFQPSVSLRSGDLVGFEALARWRRPDGSFVPPGEFIALAEEVGLIGRLGEQMLREACAFLSDLLLLHANEPLTVSVNVSARQLEDPSFADLVHAVVSEYGVPPGRLTLEVTESALIDTGAAIAAFQRLKAVGVKIAVDDFGTGYSSLSRLNQFPIDHLKIDHSFVDEMSKNPDSAIIVAAVVGLARTLSLRTVAEGIETEAQLRQLRAMRCDHGQGFLWSPALPVPAALEFGRDRVRTQSPPRAIRLPTAIRKRDQLQDQASTVGGLAPGRAHPRGRPTGDRAVEQHGTDPTEDASERS